MDPNKAFEYGKLVEAAYAVPTNDLSKPPAGATLDPQYDPYGRNYAILSKIYGNDLSTDLNPGRGSTAVSYGFVLQDDGGNVVVSLRGTEGIWEWLHDAMYLSVPCPINRGAGFTEDGFTAIYRSMTLDPLAGAPQLAQALQSLPLNKAPVSMTVCGHSLGGALATLLAFDLALNSSFQNQSVYTYASPRTGDPIFAATYNHVAPNTYRLANRLDIVPKLPLPPMYEHVNQLIDLNSMQLVKMDIPCQHFINTYMYLISRLPGATKAESLDAGCAAPSPSLIQQCAAIGGGGGAGSGTGSSGGGP
jgi:hypothetical protein